MSDMDKNNGIKGWELLIAAVFILSLSISCGGAGKQHKENLVIYAAASTTELITEAAQQFTAGSGIEVAFEFSSSGSLARKIEAGSPTDIFISASENWIEYADRKGLLQPGSRVMFARNSLVFVEPVSAAPVISTPEELIKADRICIGDPEHVPAGRYAKQAMEYYGLWNILSGGGKLVLATNVRDVLSHAEQGDVTGGIVYSTDAIRSRRVKAVFAFPDDSHKAITYHAGIVAASSEKQAAAKFLEFLGGDKFAGLLAKHGFKRP